MKSNAKDNFSARLRSLMQDRKVRNKDLAAGVAVLPPAVSRWLNGSVPEFPHAKKIADFFAVSVNWLITGEGSIDLDERQQLGRYVRQHADSSGLIRNVDQESPRSLHESLKQARLKKGLSFPDLAKITRRPADALQRLEDGTTKNASESMIRAVCQALDLDPEKFLGTSDHGVVREGMEGTFGATPEIVAGPGVGRPVFVPYISMAAAGTMSGSVFTDEAYAYEGTIAFAPEDRRAFGVKIVGDSMQPDYRPGDIVIVYPNHQPQSNKLVICRLTDDAGGEVLFKIYQPRESGRRVILSSYNPAYPPVEYQRKDFVWIYPVRGLSRRID